MSDESGPPAEDASGSDRPNQSNDRVPAWPAGGSASDDGGPLAVLRTYALAVLRHARIALDEHRSAFLVSTALFVVGLLAGLGMAAAGIDLLELLGLDDLSDALPEDAELTVKFLFRNNSRVLLMLVAGALTLGLLTAFLLGYNGLLVGWVVGWTAGDVGIGLLLALLVPHGVLELPAFWLGGAVALRFVHVVANYLRGARDHVLTRAEAGRTLLLVLLAWLLIGLAAVIEVHVTPAIAEAIFGSAETGGI